MKIAMLEHGVKVVDFVFPALNDRFVDFLDLVELEIVAVLQVPGVFREALVDLVELFPLLVECLEVAFIVLVVLLDVDEERIDRD